MEITNSGRSDDRPVMIAQKAFDELCPTIRIAHTSISQSADKENATGVYSVTLQHVPLSPEYISGVMAPENDPRFAKHFEFGQGDRDEIVKSLVDKIMFETGFLVRFVFEEMTEEEINTEKSLHSRVLAKQNAPHN